MKHIQSGPLRSWVSSVSGRRMNGKAIFERVVTASDCACDPEAATAHNQVDRIVDQLSPASRQRLKDGVGQA